MPDIVISAAASLGPLSVDVLGSSGQHQNTSPILLSSRKNSDVVRDVPPGTYAIVATRPSGEALVHQVVVGTQTANAIIDVPTGNHSFLKEEAQRGFVPGQPGPGGSRLSGDLFSKGFAASVSGVARVNLDSIAANNAVQAEFFPTLRAGLRHGAAGTQGAWYRLSRWDFAGNSWSDPKDVDPAELTPSYIRVPPPENYGQAAAAYALLDENEFGPVVIVPRFSAGLDLTFLADGVNAQHAADRVLNPSAARVPVAIATPKSPRVADLLAALNAPALPNALALWRQESGGSDASVEVALNLLADKTSDLAAGVLAALFLARFDPSAAPIDWLSNLVRLLPHCADPPMLLAWRLINGDLADAQDAEQIRKLLQDTSDRQCCLFARTRSMLTQANQLYNPKANATVSGQGHITVGPGDFLNYAADASGLESFWGSNPRKPGRPTPSSMNASGSGHIRLENGQFSPAVRFR